MPGKSAAGSLTIDLTQIVIALIGLVVPAIGAWLVSVIHKHFKDRRMAALLENAVTNAVGIVQQAAAGVAIKTAPHVNVSAHIAPGVTYVLDHASEAVEYFSDRGTGMPPTKIAEKIVAKEGLAAIQTNLAATASAATPDVVPPLAPVPDVATLNRQEFHRLRDQQGIVS